MSIVPLMSRVVNLTPHAINFVSHAGEHVSLPPAGTVARVETSESSDGVVDVEGCEIEVGRILDLGVVGLPPEDGEAMFVVSRVVAQAAPERRDLLFPLDLLRDESGTVMGCRRLGRLG